MVNVGIAIFAIGFVIAVFFIIYFIGKEYVNENSHSAEVLDELDRVYQEPNKKVKSIETQPTKVKSIETPPTKIKSFQLELVETEPIQQCVIQAFKEISEE